ncbi:MAG: peptide deformylase [Bacteroidota bacterium]
MILPIISYSDSILRKRCIIIDKNYFGLEQLIADMFETLRYAKGIGLAAPQIGKAIRLFIVDGNQLTEDGEYPEMKNFKKILINAEIINESGDEWIFNEGCLSIPKIREDVKRNSNIIMKYQDKNFVNREEAFSGMAARIIQHEYDHTKGKLFIDRIKPLRRRLLKSKLNDISKGNVEVEYKMKFPNKK